jgi:hypothetical protein
MLIFEEVITIVIVATIVGFAGYFAYLKMKGL